MESIWTENALLPHFETLKGDTKTDVLIIGGMGSRGLCVRISWKKRELTQSRRNCLQRDNYA